MISRHILVVDPDQASRLIAKQTLSTHFHVATLSSSIEAVAYCQVNTPDIVLINATLCMSMDCIGLLVRLRRRLPSLRAFVTTSFITEDRVALLKRAGFEGILNKPLNIENPIFTLTHTKVVGGAHESFSWQAN